MPGDPSPFNLTSENTINGQQWRLPRRPWGAGWYMPWIVMGIGIAIAMIFGFSSSYKLPNFDADPIGAVFDLLWLIGQCIAPLIGLTLLCVGLGLLRGQTLITLTKNEIITSDRLGALRWTRRTITANITGLDISVGTSSTNNGPKVPMKNVTVLVAKTDQPARYKNTKDKKQIFVIAWGYPKTWMQQLADALIREASFATPSMAEIEVTTTLDHEHEDDQPENPIDQPVDSQVLLSRQPDGLTLDIPPSGIMRGSKGLGCFAVLWNGFILIMGGVMAFAVLNPHTPNVSGPTNPSDLLFLLPFLAVGIGLIAITAHLGRSRSRLVVIGRDENAVIAWHRQSPILKVKELTWPASELSHLRVGDSNMSVNDKPIQELQIHPKHGKKIGLLRRLEDSDLRWMAYELRQQTGVSRRKSK